MLHGMTACTQLTRAQYAQTVIVTAVIHSNSSSITETYRSIGDGPSVSSVVDSLSFCNINVTLPYVYFTGHNQTSFNATDDGSLPKPEQMVQWYRASSFGLALDGYNNTAAFAADSSSIPDTPLPPHDAPFLACLNSTIGSRLPLAVVPHHRALHPGQVVGIALGVFAVVVLGVFGVWCWTRSRAGRKARAPEAGWHKLPEIPSTPTSLPP